MPKRLTMPTEAELPHGPHRAFVAELFSLYRAADSPPLEELEAWIKENEELKGAPSRELIRRVLKGKAVPYRWLNVEAIAHALMVAAGYKPDDMVMYEIDYNDHRPAPRMVIVRMLWRSAVDGDDLPIRELAPPSQARRASFTDDPWATAAPAGGSGGNFDDEPPF
ncbi:hypothetical protein [Catellatospora vulcania]|uniref:hypothetical protein n=1 Tax=Catellatospora vulcania TaxID=1460450 RepID=UPI001E5AADF7|nr:hypothetical protein [Catellatospora vulcania]